LDLKILISSKNPVEVEMGIV